MARLFDDGASEYLLYSGAVVNAPPFTVSCWFNTDDEDTTANHVCIGNQGDHSRWVLYFNGANQRLYWTAINTAGGQGQAFTAENAVVQGAWQHGCGIEYASNSRAVLIDGGGKVANAVDISPTNIDSTGIGVRTNKFAPLLREFWSGRLAEAAIWNTDLADAEVAILAQGYSPLFVRPQNLVAYWPLIRDEDQDRVGGYDMTPVNGPAIAAHLPVIYPAPRAFMMAPAGAPAVGQPMMLRGTTVPGLRQWHPRV